MAKGLPFLLLRNSAILKPKNQNEDIWNSNGDVPTVGNTNSCFATHFWGCRSKKWRLSLKNCGRAQCLYPFQLSSVLEICEQEIIFCNFFSVKEKSKLF